MTKIISVPNCSEEGEVTDDDAKNILKVAEECAEDIVSPEKNKSNVITLHMVSYGDGITEFIPEEDLQFGFGCDFGNTSFFERRKEVSDPSDLIEKKRLKAVQVEENKEKYSEKMKRIIERSEK